MTKIATISSNNITPRDEVIAFIYECICCVFMGLSLRNWNHIAMFLITLPFFIIITLVIHEYIHILFFKIFSKEAKIKVINDNFKNIYIYQYNKNVFYTKLQTITILLSPLVFISFITWLLLQICNETILVSISVNGIINAMGAMTDVVLSLKLLTFKDKIFINYEKKRKHHFKYICKKRRIKMFKEGDLVTIDSETSKYNGSCCKVIGYTNRKCKDIIKVQLEENHIIQVRDYSLKYTTVYDIIRKMSDSELEATMPNEILENIKEKYLSKEENN